MVLALLENFIWIYVGANLSVSYKSHVAFYQIVANEVLPIP